MPISEARRTIMIGPWRLLRFVFRVIAVTAASWFLVAVLWAALPYPSFEHDGDSGSDYATSVLRAGKVLTRVYCSGHPGFSNDRYCYALDYQVDFENATLLLSGAYSPGPVSPLRILDPTAPAHDDHAETILAVNATARIADTDGANLPWFPEADAALLFWQIHGETIQVPLLAKWILDGDVQTLFLSTTKYGSNEDVIFSVQIHGADLSTLVATVPERPLSSSPSITYPIRVMLIYILAPTSVWLNDHLGEILMQPFFKVLWILFGVSLYLFWITAIVVSCWRYWGGPSLETTIARIQATLEREGRFQRLRAVPLPVLKIVSERLEKINENEDGWASWALEICKNGWHPERARAVKSNAIVDVESHGSSSEALKSPESETISAKDVKETHS